MPNRIIKESICTSDSVDQMTWFEECFWQRLIVNCDDYGRFDARIPVLKARLFPLKEKLQNKEIESAIEKLSEIGCIVLYKCSGKPYLYLPSWENHQTIRAKKSKYPSPDSQDSSDEIICKQMQADASECSRNPIQSESNTKSESNAISNADKPRKFTKPTLEQVSQYINEKGYDVDARKFFDYYESSNWHDAKGNAVKNWKQKVITWSGRGDGKAKKPTGIHSDEDYMTSTSGYAILK